MPPQFSIYGFKVLTVTIVITLGNEDQFIQLSDRRTTSGSSVVSEEADKAASYICANGRFVVGFSGLAQAGGFRTREWIIEQLLECSKPDYLAFETLQRFNDVLSSSYSLNPWLRKLPKSMLRLSIIFSGYLYHHEPPLAVCAIFTNFQDFQSGQDDDEPWSEFQPLYHSEKRPSDQTLTYIQRIGMWPAMTNADVSVMRVMLEKRLPVKAIVNKGVEKIREIADRPISKGTIGKQISSIVLPRDAIETISTGYHSDVVSYDVFMPSLVVAVSKGESFAAKDLSISATDASGETKAMSIPKAAKNRPCPCGSGRKYKHCHGKL